MKPTSREELEQISEGILALARGEDMSQEIVIPTKRTVRDLLASELETRLQVAMSEQMPISPYIFTRFLNDHAGELAYIGHDMLLEVTHMVAEKLGLEVTERGYTRVV
jgi:hypothetical protein